MRQCGTLETPPPTGGGDLRQLLCAPLAGAATVECGLHPSLGDRRLNSEIRDQWKAAGLPVVRLHGGGGNLQTSFANQIDFLAHLHRVIAVEMLRALWLQHPTPDELNVAMLHSIQ